MLSVLNEDLPEQTPVISSSSSDRLQEARDQTPPVRGTLHIPPAPLSSSPCRVFLTPNATLHIAMVLLRSSSRYIFVSVFSFLFCAQAVDQHAVMAMSSKPQELMELPKTIVLPGARAEAVLLNTKSLLSSDLQSSSSLLQAMQEQIKSAKQIASLSRLTKHPRLLRELRLRIKDSEQALRASVVDAELPKSARDKMNALRQAMLRAAELHDKCEDTIKRLRLSVMANEDKVLALREENKNLGRLAARTMPKGFHCLALQLTIQYYNNLGEGLVFKDRSQIDDSGLLHYVVYTENILAAAAIVNSTVNAAKEPHRHIFHVLTDGINHAAMQMWFQSNIPEKAIVEVKNLESLDALHTSSGLHEKSRNYPRLAMSKSNLKQAEDMEEMKRLRLYYDLPRVFPRLEKVLVLEDDIIVRKDLSHLWTQDLDNKVIGAVASCKTSGSQGGAHGWACMNMVDLGEWRRQRLSETLKREVDIRGALSVLRENNVHLLGDSACHVIDVDDSSYKLVDDGTDVAAVHYGHYAKPWLGMGVSRHRSLWTRFVDYDNPLLQACNIHK